MRPMLLLAGRFTTVARRVKALSRNQDP